MLKILLPLATCLLLAGCASMQEMAQKECIGLGMKLGTPEYANCYEQSLARRQSAIN